MSVARAGGLPRPARMAVAAAGLVAVAVAVWLGTRALITAPAPTPSRPTTIEHITVSRPPLTIPLSDQQILALLDREPDFGPLTDPHRRASCLAGLGYPADARVLGARPSTSPAVRPCCCCCPPTRPAPCRRSRWRRPAAQSTPACRLTGSSTARKVAGTAPPTLAFQCWKASKSTEGSA